MNFVASDPTIGEWRRLLRSLFADGGLFASGCTYPDSSLAVTRQFRK